MSPLGLKFVLRVADALADHGHCKNELCDRCYKYKSSKNRGTHMHINKKYKTAIVDQENQI